MMEHAPMLLSTASKAPLYLDPGSGSLIMQVLIATLLGAALLLRGFWSKIFRRGAGPKDENPDEHDDDGDE
jgi:hypothetical protein